MASGDNRHWVANLDDEAERRRDQASFHVFAEGEHSDSRGQLYNLMAGHSLGLPHDRWPDHVFIILGIRGDLEAIVEDTTIGVRPLSQLVVLPGVACTLLAVSDASVELVSFRSVRAPTGRVQSAGLISFAGPALSWTCCFCGDPESIGDPVSVEIQVGGPDNESQDLRAHARCLQPHLHQTVPLLDPR